jgi:membrane-bound lytic murein transglycosylase A
VVEAGRSASAVCAPDPVRVVNGHGQAHPTHLHSIAFADLPGWRDDDHGAALAALQLSCGAILERGGAFGRDPAYGGEPSDWLEVCRRALRGAIGAAVLRGRVRPGAGVRSGSAAGPVHRIFRARGEGSRTRGGPYQVPIYKRPDDLEAFDAAARQATGLAYGRRIGNTPAPYHSRKEIETGALAGQNLELVWLGDWADAFFLQIQGSGACASKTEA